MHSVFQALISVMNSRPSLPFSATAFARRSVAPSAIALPCEVFERLESVDIGVKHQYCELMDCRECQHENLAEARFCKRCSNRLSAKQINSVTVW